MKILLSSIILLSSLQAGELLSKLPYGIKMGEKVPSKVERNMKHHVAEYYHVPGKFAINFPTYESRFVSGIYFEHYNSQCSYKLPKKWKKAKIKLCNTYNKGSSYQFIKNLIKKENAYEIEELSGKNSKIIKFRIDNDKKYYVSFGIEPEEYCQGGLNYIQVNLFEEEDY